MSRKSNKKSKSFIQFQGRGAIRPDTSFAASSRLVGMSEPFKVAQATSGVGCLTSNLTGVSLTAGTNFALDPFAIGSRCALFANLFQQWRVNRIELQYEADSTNSGVVNTQGGPSTTPSYGSRPFAIGWNRDPSLLNVIHTSIVEAGGVMTNTSRNSPVLRIPRSPWLFTGTVGAYLGSGIDLRLAAHGNISAAFVDASSTATATYGRIVIKYDLSFRYPQNFSNIGSSINLSLKKPQLMLEPQKQNKDEKKEDGEKRWF